MNNEKKFYFFYFLLGTTSFLTIDIIGKFFLIEILLILIFFKNIAKNNLNKLEKRIILLLIFFLIIISISNFINNVSLNNFLKGLGNYSFFILTILSIYNLFRNKDLKNFNFFFTGFIIGQIIGRFYFDSQLWFYLNYWKWGLGYLTIISIYYFFLIKKIKLNIFSLTCLNILFILVSLLYNARWLSLVLITSYIVFFIAKFNFKIIKNYIFFFISSIIIFYSIGYLTSSNILFKYFPKVYERNLYSNPYEKNQVIASRPYIFVIKDIISSKPIFGHGSYAEDVNYEFTIKLKDRLYQNLYIDDTRIKKTNRALPTHSIIFQSISENGLITLFFWLPFFSIIFSQINKDLFYKHYFFSFILVYFINYIFFQPLGFTHRLENSIIISLIFLFNHKNKQTND